MQHDVDHPAKAGLLNTAKRIFGGGGATVVAPRTEPSPPSSFRTVRPAAGANHGGRVSESVGVRRVGVSQYVTPVTQAFAMPDESSMGEALGGSDTAGPESVTELTDNEMREAFVFLTQVSSMVSVPDYVDAMEQTVTKMQFTFDVLARKLRVTTRSLSESETIAATATESGQMLESELRGAIADVRRLTDAYNTADSARQVATNELHGQGQALEAVRASAQSTSARMQAMEEQLREQKTAAEASQSALRVAMSEVERLTSLVAEQASSLTKAQSQRVEADETLSKFHMSSEALRQIIATLPSNTLADVADLIEAPTVVSGAASDAVVEQGALPI